MGDETCKPASEPRSETQPPSVRAADRDLSIDDLVYLNRMTTVGQVLPTVAHELNNTLQVVGGLVEMLSARADLPRDVLDKVARIGAQAGRATAMIRDLVIFARREDAGTRPIDLAKVIERTLAMRRYHLARSRITVVVDAGPPGAFVTQADGHAIQQVLLNVLINAEHELAGSEGGAIRIALREGEGTVELEVGDNGPGVPAHLRNRIGEPFFTTKERAAGLGLAVAAALVALEGGRLDLEHLADGGTRVVMTLPRPRRTG
jgi:C4-dicarboxylate-specific signal transduction histidine kinase